MVVVFVVIVAIVVPVVVVIVFVVVCVVCVVFVVFVIVAVILAAFVLTFAVFYAFTPAPTKPRRRKLGRVGDPLASPEKYVERNGTARPKALHPYTDQLRVLSWNVNGIRARMDKEEGRKVFLFCFLPWIFLVVLLSRFPYLGYLHTEPLSAP